jgi:hypothetical protein
MRDISSLPASLARRAAADPESPFLFWAVAWRWKWWSWSAVAALTAQWAGDLAGLPPGERVGFAGDGFPHAIPLDLALQAAGLTPAPLALWPWPGEPAVETAVRAMGCVAWVEAEPAGGLRVSRLAAAAASPPPDHPAVLLADAHGDCVWREQPLATVVAAAERMAEVLGPGAQEIVVLGRSLGEPLARLVATWAVMAAAALVAAPAGTLLATVLWARPTIFCGVAAEVAALRLEVAKQPRRRGLWNRRPLEGRPDNAVARAGRLPLGRLRLVLQEEPAAPTEVAWWAALGVRLERLPTLPLPGPPTP